MSLRPGAGRNSLRPGARARWTVLAALATGCCATQPSGREPPPVSGPGDGGPDVDATPVEFAVIDASEARRRLWPEPGPRAYVAPDDAQAQALAALIRGMLADPQPPLAELAATARASGFAVEGWEIDGRRYLAAIEVPDRRGGGGAYIVRVGAAAGPAVILQAPHGFYDLWTERIALDLLLADAAWPRALFVNTIHRYIGADGVKRKQADSPADPCHSDRHLLAVATAAALDAQPGAEVVQLHGFGDNDDPTVGPQPAAIVSGGKADAPTPRSREIAARLRDALGVEVALFPVDTDRLGATTNVQGRAIHARGGGDFVHIEMSGALRERLRDEPGARERLAAALRDRPPAAGTQ